MRGDELLPRELAALISGNETLSDEPGRPVDLAMLPDGSLLVSDDYAGAIYRVSYAAQ